MSGLLLVLALVLAALAVLVAEQRRIRFAVFAYAAQGALIALMLLLASLVSHQHALMGAAATILVAKVLILPWLLQRFARTTGAQEGEPPALGSIGAALAAAVGLAAGQFGLAALLADIPGGGGSVPYGLGAGVGVIAVALWTVIAHRDSLKVVLGICLLENGAHLLLAAIAPTIPEIASVAVVLDVILAVWLLLVVGSRAEKATGSRSDRLLDQLRG